MRVSRSLSAFCVPLSLSLFSRIRPEFLIYFLLLFARRTTSPASERKKKKKKRLNEKPKRKWRKKREYNVGSGPWKQAAYEYHVADIVPVFLGSRESCAARSIHNSHNLALTFKNRNFQTSRSRAASRVLSPKEGKKGERKKRTGMGNVRRGEGKGWGEEEEKARKKVIKSRRRNSVKKTR